MNGPLTLSFDFKPQKIRSGRAQPPPPPPGLPKGNVPRVAKLLALAHHFEELRRSGVVADYSDLARLGGVTRARMSQVMGLLNLAPDIQEEVLYLPLTTSGFDPITTRDLLPLSQQMPWSAQREAWEKLRAEEARGD
jgi:hypothetical protein